MSWLLPMVDLLTFQEYSIEDFNEEILELVIIEINNYIKAEPYSFRLLISLLSDSIESRLYKNAITGYYISKGFKIVNYEDCIYLDWARPNVYLQKNKKPTFKNLGNHFDAADLYLSLTDNKDLRSVSYLTLAYRVNREVAVMEANNVDSRVISLDISTTLTADQLNSMYAPELLKYSLENDTVNLSFVDYGNLRIQVNSIPDVYPDIEYKILFGTTYP